MKTGIIVVYHNFINKFILPCLESIRKNVLSNKFVCVFDNESSHQEAHKVADYCQRHEDFLHVRINDQHGNGGLTGAWNQGIDYCIQNKCDQVFILNDDILINGSWQFFTQVAIQDNVIYGPITNNPGYAWINKRYYLKPSSWFKKIGRVQHAHDHQGQDVDPVQVGFVNGFCFGCTTQTFINNKYDVKHYFDPSFPFGGNETEFQLRLFDIEPSSDNELNKRKLTLLEAHNRALVVPRCFVFHYKNHAWKKGNGGKYSEQEFA